MKKIPLETTLAGAYRFLFTRIVSIIGTIWLPYALLAALVAGIAWLTLPHEWFSGHFPSFEGKQAFMALVPFMISFYPLFTLAAIICTSMIFVGLMRHSLGMKKTPTFIYFSLGAPVWRLILAEILACIVIALIAIAATLLVVAVAAFGAPHLPHGYGTALTVVLGVVAVCFVIYAAVRLTFFLPAVVVAEDKLGLGRSWELGGGNFWRILFVILLIYIPVAFVAGIVSQMTILPVVFGEMIKLGPHPSSATMQAFIHALLPLIPVYFGIHFLQKIATTGLMAGAIGTAYNAVTEPAKQENAGA